MRRAFVTGASGRIGSLLVRALRAEGSEVVGLTRTRAAASRLESTGSRAVVGSLGDERALDEGIAGADEVYHLAGGVRGRGPETPDALNRVGTERLVDALGKSGARPAVVLASAWAIYGDRSGLWVDESVAPFPNTAFGESKVSAEKILLGSGADVRVARLALVYGRDFPILQAVALPGEGRNVIPLVHADDAVAALMALARNDRARGITNVADRDPRPFHELFDAAGHRVRFWSTWLPSAIQLAVAAENESIQARLGRKPRFTTDNLRLYTASVRMNVERLGNEIGYAWRHPTLAAGARSLGLER